MKKALLIIPLAILLVSCGEERTIDASQIQDRNGVAYAINEQEPYSGKVTTTYPNGQLQIEMSISIGEKHGVAREWYENGQLSGETPFVNGKQDGEVRYWFESGQLRGQAAEHYYLITDDMDGMGKNRV